MIATDLTDLLADRLTTWGSSSDAVTGIGSNVLVGQVRGAEQQAPCVFVLPERLSYERRYAQEQVSRDYRIAAFVRLSDHPGLSEHALVDQLIIDIRTAMETRTVASDSSSDGVPAGSSSSSSSETADTLTALGATLQCTGAQPGYHEDGGRIVGAAVTYTLIYSQAAPA